MGPAAERARAGAEAAAGGCAHGRLRRAGSAGRVMKPGRREGRATREAPPPWWDTSEGEAIGPGRRDGRSRREEATPWWDGEAPVVPARRRTGARPGPRRHAAPPSAPADTGPLAPVIPLRPAGTGPAPSPFTSLGPAPSLGAARAGRAAGAAGTAVSAPTSGPTVTAGSATTAGVGGAGWTDTMPLPRAHARRPRPAVHPPDGSSAPPRRMATLGWAVAGGIGTAAALAVAWFVLVIVRFDAPVARRSLAVARIEAAAAAGRSVDHVLSVATWVGYVCTTLALGVLVFRAVVRRAPRRLPIVAVAAAGVSAAVASVALRCMEVTGGGIEAVGDRDVLAHVVTSPFGSAMALRGAGLLLVVASLGGRPGGGLRRAGRWVAGAGRLAGAAVLVASYLVIGHAQASDPVAVEVTALGVHIVAAAAWFGGVAVLAFDLRPGPPDRVGHPRLPAPAVARFSRMAEVMVVLVIVSGAVLAEGQNLFARAPWTTGYGQAFIAKLAFVAVVLAIGGYNRQRVVPAVAERDDAAARAHLRTTCVLEALVISMGILLMTAAMTSGGF